MGRRSGHVSGPASRLLRPGEACEGWGRGAGGQMGRTSGHVGGWPAGGGGRWCCMWGALEDGCRLGGWE